MSSEGNISANIKSGIQAFYSDAKIICRSTEVQFFVELDAEWQDDVFESSFDIKWNFGDGKTSTQFRPTHVYQWPGNYNVTVSIHNPALSSDLYYEKFQIEAEWNAPDYVYFSSEETFSTSPLSSVPQGEPSEPILVEFYTNDIDNNPEFFFEATNSLSFEYNSENASKWDHLLPKWAFLKEDGSIIPKNSLEIPKEDCEKVYSDSGKLIGLMGKFRVRYKDDFPRMDCEIGVSMNSAKKNISGYVIKDQTSYSGGGDVKDTLTLDVVERLPSKLTITSNGLESFPVPKTNYYGYLIPFTICISDASGLILKQYPKTEGDEQTPVDVRLEGGITNEFGVTEWVTLSSGFEFHDDAFFQRMTDNENEFGRGGFYHKGVLVINDLEYDAYKIVADSDVLIYPSLSGFETLSGESNEFYSQSFEANLDFRKQNENLDISDVLRGYALQERIAENKILWEEWVAGMLDEDGFGPDSIGLSVYEKIANFVRNLKDNESADLKGLYDMLSLYGAEGGVMNYQKTNSPQAITRIENILSISKNVLWGEYEKKRFDFSDRFNIGKNLGEIINVEFHTFKGGETYVVNITGTNSFDVLYLPDQIDGQVEFDFRSLSAVGLRDPIPLTYTIYRYVDHIEIGDQTEGVVDWHNPYTTIPQELKSFNLWAKNNGAMEQIIQYHLTKNLLVDKTE